MPKIVWQHSLEIKIETGDVCTLYIYFFKVKKKKSIFGVNVGEEIDS